ncbi:uncharacterized protein CTHT_0008360 [Thermochaetoides thermophila DSM 1495]|uniref:Asl1-like glycosyl hydrolase catalytic domain-containing protein n=1 Tax=Chaetomium thermophilum (strain DSM 1495 / CBS 144.50 / IMI 039719) TaxID=759272 RepID=G0S012_CHATD|nr:hypothetical protein CTHT_0008360 [Thermochaetoides thermophila DSM 1495]EGS23173.1 hypothetical protein CTHT_0008360 [Thermochaetoides thermophila DSM 1495]
MHSNIFLLLAVAGLAGQALAAIPGGHGHLHGHQKRALVTEVVTVTDWVTVTVTLDFNPHTRFYTNKGKTKDWKTKQISTSTFVEAAALSTPNPAVPTTIVTQVISADPAPEVSPLPAAESVVPPPLPPPPASTQSTVVENVQSAPSANPGVAEDENSGSNSHGSSGKRGLAYNDPTLLKRFVNSGTKISWTYNWGQYDDSGLDLEFCPMLWGLKLDFPQIWPTNAQKAIGAGSRCLFSFNEPDLDSQANMSPELAAQKHVELMNPFAGKAKIGAPAITNSGAPHQGIGWLQKFFNACNGQCAVDFVNIHIYGVDTKTFLNHVLNVYSTFKKPVWITEFAFDGTEEQINAQLTEVIHQLENNATFSFVERYAYFMVSEGHLVRGNTLSVYGNTFAYGS